MTNDLLDRLLKSPWRPGAQERVDEDFVLRLLRWFPFRPRQKRRKAEQMVTRNLTSAQAQELSARCWVEALGFVSLLLCKVSSHTVRINCTTGSCRERATTHDVAEYDVCTISLDLFLKLWSGTKSDCEYT